MRGTSDFQWHPDRKSYVRSACERNDCGSNACNDARALEVLDRFHDEGRDQFSERLQSKLPLLEMTSHRLGEPRVERHRKIKARPKSGNKDDGLGNYRVLTLENKIDDHELSLL